LDILQGIKKGSTDPASLLPSQRKLIVPFLVAEGQSTAEIAHLPFIGNFFDVKKRI